jgi:hypothetical protein
VLLLAANTSYNDFPRVLFLMAGDRQAPRSFLHIGDGLTFRSGIVLLSVSAAAIYVGFRGKTEALLPLYAVGVFLPFTPSLRPCSGPPGRRASDRHTGAMAGNRTRRLTVIRQRQLSGLRMPGQGLLPLAATAPSVFRTPARHRRCRGIARAGQPR